MPLKRISLREIRKHPSRALLTLASIVIGVAAVVAVTMATATTRRAYQMMYQSTTGRADLELTAEGDQSFDENLFTIVEQTPGVAGAVPLVQRLTVLYFGKNRANLVAMGVDPQRDRLVRDFELVDGDFLEDGKGLVLDDDVARGLGVKVGDEVKLLVGRGFIETTVVGLLRPGGPSQVSHAGVVFMPIRSAQSRFKLKGQLTSIQIVLDKSADEKEVLAALEPRLPPGVSVHRPATRSSQADEMMLSTQQGLDLARAFSLVVAMFIIMNTFLMNVGERRRQLAILRAIGATRRQIGWLLIREALVLGLIGGALGCLAGIGGAAVLSRAMGQLFQTKLPGLEITLWPLALGMGFGLGISLFGALYPAWRASRVSPLEGMSHVHQEDIAPPSLWTKIVGVCIVLVAGSVMTGCILGYIRIEESVPSCVLLLVGAVFLLPSAVGVLSYLVVLALRPFVRVEARLARQQILRHRGRSALTIGVLFIAVSTGMGLANSVIDNVNDVKAWYGKAIIGDFVVRAMMPDVESGLAADIPDSVGEQLEHLAGIATLDRMRAVSTKVDDQSVIVIARDYPTDNQLTFDIRGDRPNDLRARLLQGEVVIGSVLAQRLGLEAGDELTLTSPSGPERLRIAAITNDYMAGGLTVHMHRDTARRVVGAEGVSAYLIRANPQGKQQLETELRKICGENGLILQSSADITNMIDRMMAGVVASLWGLLVLGVVVAAFGVVNTLTMNVLEQTRELGLLRVVAMTRRQTRRTILSQAAIIAVIALPLGAVAGVAMAYLINLSTMPVTGHPVAFQFHPVLFFGGLFVSLLIVLVAAWLPAQRAARLDLVTSLHYE